jgi:hypothetical protein
VLESLVYCRTRIRPSDTRIHSEKILRVEIKYDKLERVCVCLPHTYINTYWCIPKYTFPQYLMITVFLIQKMIVCVGGWLVSPSTGCSRAWITIIFYAS